jgi:hypothetical protein
MSESFISAASARSAEAATARIMDSVIGGYFAQHQATIEGAVAAAISEVMRERPNDPLKFMAHALLRRSGAAVAGDAAPVRQEEQQHEPP